MKHKYNKTNIDYCFGDHIEICCPSRFADIGIYGGPKISKLGHMTQATPTWGRFMVYTQVYYKKNSRSGLAWSRPRADHGLSRPTSVFRTTIGVCKILSRSVEILNNLTYLLQIWYEDGGRILPAYEPNEHQNDP